MTEHHGWRLYDLTPEGRLTPPFLWRLSPKDYDAHRDDWQPGVNIARCTAHDHPAPAEDCSCGLRLVLDRQELLSNTGEDRFLHHRETILTACGVVARVTGYGRTLPGIDMPLDDPHTTLRVNALRIEELFLADRYLPLTEALRDRYGVPVHPAPDWWPAEPKAAPAPPRPGPDGFLASLRETGMGTADLTDDAAWLGVGRLCEKSLRDGATYEDVCWAMFTTASGPTIQQAEAFVMNVLRNFAPGTLPQRGWVLNTPKSSLDVMLHQTSRALFG